MKKTVTDMRRGGRRLQGRRKAGGSEMRALVQGTAMA